MALKELRFRSGITRDITHYANGGGEQPGWWDCDKVRFRMGFPESIGGWIRATQTWVLGAIRNLFAWSLLSGDQIVAVGSENVACLLTSFGLYDITPIADETTAGDLTLQLRGVPLTTLLILPKFATSEIGDVITLDNPGNAPVGGPTDAQMTGRWLIIDPGPGGLPGYDPLTDIVVNVAGPGVVPFQAATHFGDVTTIARLYGGGGTISPTIQVGWGSGPWGDGPWGGAIPGGANPFTVVNELPNTVSFDNFGQNLMFCWRGGPLYLWSPDDGYDLTGLGASGRGQLISGMLGANEVPETAYEIMVSEQTRVAIAFGTNSIDGDFDPLLFRWSDQESYLEWEPTPSNSAGELHLQAGSVFVTATKTRREILAWTDRSLNSVQFIGGDLVFGIEVMGRGLSIAGPNAKIAIDDDVYWMGTDNFYHYSGVVAPIPCTILEYVFSDFNYLRAWTVACGYEATFNEIKWFYPSAGSQENDRYVLYNRADGSWSIGRMERTAWLHRCLQGRSAGASLDGYLYAHEVGQNDGSTTPASPIVSHIVSSPFETGNGDQFTTVWRMIPDLTFRNSTATVPRATFVFETMEEPGSGIESGVANDVFRTATSITIQQFTKIVYLRLRSRMATMRIMSSDLNVGWRLGIPRLDGRLDGRR